jgi:archaellum biogenesis ATPase FlaH
MSKNYYYFDGKVALVSWERSKKRALLRLGYLEDTMEEWLLTLFVDKSFTIDNQNDDQSVLEIIEKIRLIVENQGLTIPTSVFHHLTSDMRSNIRSARIIDEPTRVHHMNRPPILVINDPFKIGLFEKTA